MAIAEAEERQIACPQCRTELPVEPGYAPWCDRCGWNVQADEPPPAPNLIVRAYESLGRRQSQRLFEGLLKHPTARRTLTPADLAAFVVAALVHGVTLACVALGLAAIVWAWPNPFGFLIACPLFLLAWLLAPQLPPRPDIVLDRRDFPAHYALADAVADALGTTRVAGIAFDMEFNAAFGRVGWRRHNIMQLGAPFWAILDDGERTALMAHELAHGANRDPNRGFFVGGAITTLAYWQRILNPPVHVEGGDPVSLGMFALRCLSLIPGGLLFILSHLLWRSSQRAEYLADHLAATVGGSAAVLSLLRKLDFERDYRHVVQWVAQGRKQGLFETLRQRVAWVPERELERRHRAAQSGAARLDVSHPPIARRIALLDARPMPPLASVAGALDHEKLAAEIAAIEEAFERDLVVFYDQPWRWS